MEPVTAADLHPVVVTDGADLIDLFDDLRKGVNMDSRDDRRDFRHNQIMIASAYRRGALCFFVDKRGMDLDLLNMDLEPLRAPWKSGRIPAFAIAPDESGGCSVIWVRWDWRRRGYGRAIANLLKIRHVEAGPETQDFWKRIGFKATRTVSNHNAQVMYTVMEKQI